MKANKSAATVFWGGSDAAIGGKRKESSDILYDIHGMVHGKYGRL